MGLARTGITAGRRRDRREGDFAGESGDAGTGRGLAWDQARIFESSEILGVDIFGFSYAWECLGMCRDVSRN